MSWKKLLLNLYGQDVAKQWIGKKDTPPSISLNDVDIDIEEITPGTTWKVIKDGNIRHLHSKIVLSEYELRSASVLLTLYTPPNANAYLQADTHISMTIQRKVCMY